MPHEELQFWNFNIPAPKRTAKCPDYLLNVSDKDRRLIGKWDSDYQRQSWEEIRDLISTNRIDEFHRVPSELRRYRRYMDKITKEHGFVMHFMLKERLHWDNVTPTGPPFSSSNDLKILYNDWPYGFGERVVHLVVWTKFDLEDDPVTGGLMPHSRILIDDFVDRAFRSRMRPEHVLWFKNWRSLKSVHAVEHFHVLLFDPEVAFVEQMTGGDIPACRDL